MGGAAEKSAAPGERAPAGRSETRWKNRTIHKEFRRDLLRSPSLPKRIKGKVFEYFLYELATHNKMIVEMNMTYISFSKEIYRQLSDGCTDLHGKLLFT